MYRTHCCTLDKCCSQIAKSFAALSCISAQYRGMPRLVVQACASHPYNKYKAGSIGHHKAICPSQPRMTCLVPYEHTDLVGIYVLCTVKQFQGIYCMRWPFPTSAAAACTAYAMAFNHDCGALCELQTFHDCFNGGQPGSTSTRRCSTFRKSSSTSITCPAQYKDFVFAFYGITDGRFVGLSACVPG